jgi:hypothetical protein
MSTLGRRSHVLVEPKEDPMISALLLASALALPSGHVPVRAAEPIPVVRHDAPRKVDEVRINIFAYCDASQQPTIMLTNVGRADVVVAWTLTAVMPGHPTDVWSHVSFLGSGQFEGWMSPASYLRLEVHYDDDGLPTTQSIEAACPATGGEDNGLEE